jgi:hypothetical protein
MKRCYFVVVTVLALGLAAPAAAQFMYLDANGDGVCDGSDVINSELVSLDVYLVTDQNADGNPTLCPTGEVGAWTDSLGYPTGLTDQGARMEGDNDLWIALGGGAILPPGKHKLGSLAVTVSGISFLTLVSTSSMSSRASTSFASACPGAFGDNTMRYGIDFFDVCGTSFTSDATSTTWGRIKALYR